MLSAGVFGASGFAGAELLRLCAGHPEISVELASAETQAGTRIGDLYPSLAAHYGDRHFQETDPSAADGLDLVFLALPHGASQDLMGELRSRVRYVIDLAADFRLSDADLYPTWYGEEHRQPNLLGDFVYGLPELFRSELYGCNAVAAPGCYPTAAALALAPLMKASMIESTGIVVDAASGVSGAGRAAKSNTAFCTVDEDFVAYGLLNHRHTPEIEQTLALIARGGGNDVRVLFTPHLAPMNRGILATCYARPTARTSTAELLDLFRTTYFDEPFVVVTDQSPSTKATFGSNAVHVTVRFDERTGFVLAIAALDNLVKGASGQAVQCANVLAGLDETVGLTSIGVYP